MPSKPQIEHLFDAIAPSYDKLNHIMSFGIDRSWRRKAVRTIADSPQPLRVLDVATGTGDFAIAIARKLQKGSEIIGIDLSEKMLEVGRQKVLKKAGMHLMQHIGNEIELAWEEGSRVASVSENSNQSELCVNIALQQGDVEQLAFADGSFDRVSVAFGVRNFEHLVQGLSEMHRVLRPGGKLVILELSYPDNPFVLWCYKLYALHFLPFIGGMISGKREAYTYLPNSILAFPKADRFVPLLQQAGFSQVTVRKFTFGTCVMYVSEKSLGS